MKAIVIYAEGGGNTAAERAALRVGFDGLFQSVKELARKKRLRWDVVPCGGRDEAFRSFAIKLSQTDATNTLVVLLVDSEEPLAPVRNVAIGENDAEVALRKKADAQIRKDHLLNRDTSWTLKGIPPEHIHLMVQSMETWIVSDPATVAKFYGKDFHAKSLPNRLDLESEPKRAIATALVNATKDTQKGVYEKIKHAGKLLGLITPDGQRCPRYSTFITWLTDKIDDA